MIRIGLAQKDHKITGFTVAGHSGTAPKGEDIVCAGVSALTQAALMGLTEHLKRSDVTYKMESGLLEVRLAASPDDCTEAVLRSMSLGLEAIAEQYPRAVKLEMTEGRTDRND